MGVRPVHPVELRGLCEQGPHRLAEGCLGGSRPIGLGSLDRTAQIRIWGKGRDRREGGSDSGRGLNRDVRGETPQRGQRDKIQSGSQRRRVETGGEAQAAAV
ncbi:MAG: hypothetical protein COR54_16850 [Elusimicrobia bacterium CG22_combo_CG10-13_8_21_14_all_63_91]|nr:MAG: hypothetical protein COR54_16850 [Elusimicrobia bacterium CG22_combo_CG10-13_8_21_14_all_63_91]